MERELPALLNIAEKPLQSLFLGGWGRGLMRRELGFGGWDGGYWLPAVRCGLGGSPELNHRFCCVLKFGNLLFSASIQKVYQTIVNSILSPPLPPIRHFR